MAGGLLHLINSGAATLDGSGQQSRGGKPALKPFWEISESEMDKCLKATSWPSAIYEYFRGGGFSSNYLSRGGMPMTMCRISMVKGLGPALQTREGSQSARRTHESFVADDLVRAHGDRQGRVPRCLHGDEQLEREPRLDQL